MTKTIHRLSTAIAFALIILAAAIGAKAGGDVHDSMKCGCTVGWASP